MPWGMAGPPNLAECARRPVPALIPLIAHRLAAVVEAGDRRAGPASAPPDAQEGVADRSGSQDAAEVKKVRFKDRVDRQRRASKSAAPRDMAEGPSTTSRRDDGCAPVVDDDDDDANDEEASEPGCSKFFARDRPGMTVEAYLTRIITYAPIPMDALLLTLVYLNRISRSASAALADSLFPSVCRTATPPPPPADSPDAAPAAVPIDSRTVHRLLLATLLISAKFTSDAYIPHARAAKVCGVSERELHRLEVEIFKLLGWDLYWAVDELEAVATCLLHGDAADLNTGGDGGGDNDVEMADDEQQYNVPLPSPGAPPLAGAFRTDPVLTRRSSSGSRSGGPRRSSLHSDRPPTTASSTTTTTTSPHARVVNFAIAPPSPTPTPPSSSAPSTPSPPGSPYSAKSGRSSRSNTSRGSRSKSTTPRLVVAAAVEGLAEELREGMMLDPNEQAPPPHDDDWYSDVEDAFLPPLAATDDSDTDGVDRRMTPTSIHVLT